jgi:hypothetical protein
MSAMDESEQYGIALNIIRKPNLNETLFESDHFSPKSCFLF